LVYLVFDDVDSCIPSPGHRTVLYARVNFLYSNHLRVHANLDDAILAVRY
jgi:hypothetical protein